MLTLICLITAFSLFFWGGARAQSDPNSVIAGAKQEKEVVWYTTTSAGDNQAIVAGFSAWRFPPNIDVRPPSTLPPPEDDEVATVAGKRNENTFTQPTWPFASTRVQAPPRAITLTAVS